MTKRERTKILDTMFAGSSETLKLMTAMLQHVDSISCDRATERAENSRCDWELICAIREQMTEATVGKWALNESEESITSAYRRCVLRPMVEYAILRAATSLGFAELVVGPKGLHDKYEYEVEPMRIKFVHDKDKP